MNNVDWNKFVKKSYNPFRSMAFRVIGDREDDIKDIVQDVYYNLWKSYSAGVEKYQTEEDLFLYGLAGIKNRCLDMFGSLHEKKRMMSIRINKNVKIGYYDDPYSFDINVVLDVMKRALPEKQLQALTMNINGYGPSEMADMLMISRNTAKKNLLIARNKIRKLIPEYA